MHRKSSKSSIHNLVSTGTNFRKKKWLSMCLLAVLGSQGVLVKCIAAIFFPSGGLSLLSFDWLYEPWPFQRSPETSSKINLPGEGVYSKA